MFWLIIAEGIAKIRQKQEAKAGSAEKTVRDIRLTTRRRHSSEEKIRIVLEGLRWLESATGKKRTFWGILDCHLATAKALRHDQTALSTQLSAVRAADIRALGLPSR